MDLASRRRTLGLTLIELIVTIAIAAILLAIAIPSYREMTISNRLTTTANGFVSALTQARMEAVRRNTATQFCSNIAASNGSNTALGTACGTSAGAVYALNANGSVSRVHDAITIPPGIALKSGGSGITALRYSGQGLGRMVAGTGPHTGLVADIYSDQITSNNHRCIYLITGSVLSSCIHTSAGGGCPNSEPIDCRSQ